MHIPDGSGHLVRYYGAYSNVSGASAGDRTRPQAVLRLAMASRLPRLEPAGITALTPALSAGVGHSSSSAFNQVDPLLCPSCGGEMRMIAFIIDHDVVDAILRHLATADAKSPRGPPSAAALRGFPESHAGSRRRVGRARWR